MEVTHNLDRWLYRGRRPNRVARVVNGLWAHLAAAGIGPRRLMTLEITGRRSGRTVSFPVVVADHQGERYLVSMLGENTNWVRNLRAADGRAVLRHGQTDPVVLAEVPIDQRAAILKRYLECAPGARSHFPVDRTASTAEFERIAARYPVFRITPVAFPVAHPS